MRAVSARFRRSMLVSSAAGVSLSLLAGTTLADDPFDLLFDLRVHGTGGKSAQVNKLGDIVKLDLFVIIPDGNDNPLDDSLKSASGSFRSSTGGLLGDLLGLPGVAPFTAAGSERGLQQDFDADGDYDLGRAVESAPAEFDLFSFRSNDWETNMPEGGFHVGQISFTAKSLGGSTEVHWLLREAVESALFERDGLVLDGSARRVVGEPVRIFYGGPVIEPGETRFLSGTITDHLNVRGTVKSAPGTTLVLAQGVDVATGGTFDTRDAGGKFGPHEVRIENDRSGNNGGALFAGHLLIGQSGAGVFTQTGGFTEIDSNVTVGGGTGTSGTLRMTGGTLLTGPATAGHGGAALVRHTGGNATYQSLALALSPGGETVLEVGGDAVVSVAGDTRVGVAGAAVIRQSGGMSNFGGNVVFGSAGGTGRLELTGGTFAAGQARFGAAAGVGAGEQTGGTAQYQFLGVHGPSQGDASRYTIRGGVLRATTLAVGFSDGTARFEQHGGEVIATSIGIVSPHGDARFELHDGVLTSDRTFVGDGDSPGTLVQSGGDHTIDALHIKPRGEFRYGGGTLKINELLKHEGKLDFTGSPLTLRAGDRSFLDFSGGQLLNSGSSRIVAGEDSLLNFPASFDPFAAFAGIETEGLIHVAGQPLVIAEARSVHGSGSIEGDVTNEGLVSPGNSPGVLEVIGSYTQKQTGSLLVELGGTDDDDFDVLSVAGDALIDGELTVSLLGEFVPLSSDRFTVLSADALTGVFDNAPEQITIEQGTFDVIYDGDSVTLANFVAVPEPGGAALLLLASPLLIGRRRRR